MTSHCTLETTDETTTAGADDPGGQRGRTPVVVVVGGIVVAVGASMPWISTPFHTITGTSSRWGAAALGAGLLGAVAGLWLARSERSGRGHRALAATALVAGATAMTISAAVALFTSRAEVEADLIERLDRHGVADDLLGETGEDRLLAHLDGTLGDRTAGVELAIEQALEPRVETGTWTTLAGGTAMAVAAGRDLSGRRRRLNRAVSRLAGP